jgi:hypothetical protein
MKWMRNAWRDPVGSQVIAWALIGLLGLLAFWLSTLVPPARAWVFETLDSVTRAQLIGWLAFGVAVGGALGALIYRHAVHDRLRRLQTLATHVGNIMKKVRAREPDKNIKTKVPARAPDKNIATRLPAREPNKNISTKQPAREPDKSITAKKKPEREVDKSIPTKEPARELNAYERAAMKYLAEHERARVDVDDFPEVIELDGLRTNQVLNELVRRKLIVRSVVHPYQCWLTDQGRDFAIRERWA